MGLQSKHLVLNLEECTGCGICELVCGFSRSKKFNPRLSAIRIRYDYELGHAEEYTVCVQCGLCAPSCPAGAIDIVDGIVVIDYSTCTGCLVCVKACPISAIAVEDGKPFKCDLCSGNPVCVEYCVRGALYVS